MTKPAFYAMRQGSWRDYVTILHVPYTLWHLSYVAIGASLAPIFELQAMLWMTLAFFLGMGVSAHALDELKGRPLKTTIPKPVLFALATVPLTVAAAIGVASSFDAPVIIPFVVAGLFFVFAYNLEWFGGRFHNRPAFALTWGSFPLLVGYAASSPAPSTWGVELVGAILAAALISDAQRILSLRARYIRRQATDIRVLIRTQKGSDWLEKYGRSWSMEPLEISLRHLSWAMPLLAAGMVFGRAL